MGKRNAMQWATNLAPPQLAIAAARRLSRGFAFDLKEGIDPWQRRVEWRCGRWGR